MWLADIHTALANQLESHVRRNDITFSPWPDANVRPNKIEVWPGGGDYLNYFASLSASGMTELEIRVRIETVSGDADSGGRLMTELLSVGSEAPHSVVDAIHADRTLGGAVDDIIAARGEWVVDEVSHNHVGWITCQVLLKKEGAVV